MSDAIHRVVAEGFGSAAGIYERGRPGYPAEAVAFIAETLRIGPGRRVLDLGAGTGKLTRLLEPTGARMIAVEPTAAMLVELVAHSTSACTLAGAAEAIPLIDAAVDAVVVAQAFHWFDRGRALSEIHRVLDPIGRLGLVWNVRDQSVDWVARITDIVDPYAGDAPRHRSGQWRRAFQRTELFGGLHRRSFPFQHETTPHGLLDRVLSTSFIAALDDRERESVRERIRELTRSHPDLAAREFFAFPYRTDVYWCERT